MIAGKTDIGLRRSNNEDSFAISQDLEVCAAADGMGGAAAGELASKAFTTAAMEVFENTPNRSDEEIIYRVKKAFSVANEKILEHIRENPRHEGMGCTAELLAFSDRGFVLGHIGDSRTYLLRKGALKQLTLDHTLVQEQVEEGLIPLEQVKTHPLRNVILRAVGLDKELALDLLRGKTLSGDLFLLCSDGLTDMLNDDQIQGILISGRDINAKAEALIQEANDAGGNDNITVVLAEVY